MARIFTTPGAELNARSWFHDITLAAGLNTKNLKPHTPYLANQARWQQASSTICDELINREFNNIDQAIHEIAGVRFYSNGQWKALKADAIAKAIVYIAELMHLYWDDTIRTPYEIDAFKNTLLGAAVYKYNRYISAISANNTTSTRSSRSTSTGTTGQPPKSSYKQSGPQSCNVRDLRDLNGNPGTPGQKVTSSSGLMFKIIGDKTGKNTPNAFINPISKSGASGNTNKVKFSSGNGWTDCTCLFDDLTDAQNFLDTLIKNDSTAAAANARIVKFKADPNGYFLVGTEYGICAISASKLNEALTEAATKEVTEELSGWEKATKNYSKEELNELHAWMRRG